MTPGMSDLLKDKIGESPNINTPTISRKARRTSQENTYEIKTEEQRSKERSKKDGSRLKDFHIQLNLTSEALNHKTMCARVDDLKERLEKLGFTWQEVRVSGE
jgi:hypothetical protein